jgi:putative DNA primase/helicase
MRDWEARHLPIGADGQVLRAGRRFAVVAAAGEAATRAGITGWKTGMAEAAAAVVFRDWLRLRGGIGAREDQHLFATLRRFIVLHGASRFETARDPSAEEDMLGSQAEPPLPEGQRVIQRAGWRWEEIGPDGVRHWVYGISPDVFAAEISGPLGFDEREACGRLARAGMIRTATEGGETRFRVRMPWRAPGAGRPRLIVVEPRLFERAEE